MAWGARTRALPDYALLVNTTPLGMAGHPPLDIDLTRGDKALVVADIVYVPLETPLLASARALGLRTVEGLGMLLYRRIRASYLVWRGTDCRRGADVASSPRT